MFSDIIGHDSALHTLRRALLTGRVPNAYLFVGRPNVGKLTTALQLAKALNCEQRSTLTTLADVDSCDQCRNCLSIMNGSNPDVMLVQPKAVLKAVEEGGEEPAAATETEDPSQALEIEGALVTTGQIETLVEHTFLKRIHGRHKVYIVGAAHTMNKEAENRLLKTLEEPPPNTLLILVAPTVAGMLPTTISRCQTVHFEAVPTPAAVTYLQGQFPHVPAAQVHSVVALSGGRLGWAFTMLQHPEVLQVRQQLLDLCVGLPGKPMVACLRHGELLLEAAERWWLLMADPAIGEKALKAHRDRVLRTRVQDVIEVLVSWFRDLIVASADPESPVIINHDRLDDLRRLAPQYSVDKCRRACVYLEDMRKQLRQNANLRLASEAMALRLISSGPSAG